MQGQPLYLTIYKMDNIKKTNENPRTIWKPTIPGSFVQHPRELELQILQAQEHPGRRSTPQYTTPCNNDIKLACSEYQQLFNPQMIINDVILEHAPDQSEPSNINQSNVEMNSEQT